MSTPVEWYNVVCKYYLIGPVVGFAPYFFIDAPFGRFSPSKASPLLVDGIKSWMVMEIVSPVCFLIAFLSSPLTRPLTSLKRFPLSPPPGYSQTSLAGFRFLVPNPPTLLALLFLGHYANRALISPLRTPARSKAHISVPIAAIFFNIVNGSLMGAFLSALATPIAKPGIGAFLFRGSHTVVANWQYWAGIVIWAIGLASNIWHDEILLNIRRQVMQKPAKSSRNGREASRNTKPHYAIPHGGLYALVSYPNYLSEWFEWLGFAVAASALTAQLPATHVVFPFAAGRLALGALSDTEAIQRLTPPWIFFLSEVFLMLPRAWNGHKWYRKTFPDYPRNRKAVVPFLL
ncbi:hypothetical protein JB92DRAFT_3141408 [Gautieria morchelliformis]|nr:hypothetical protein JB92DRAFT_3141408 [Gautieria morchelliformis]